MILIMYESQIFFMYGRRIMTYFWLLMTTLPLFLKVDHVCRVVGMCLGCHLKFGLVRISNIAWWMLTHDIDVLNTFSSFFDMFIFIILIKKEIVVKKFLTKWSNVYHHEKSSFWNCWFHPQINENFCQFITFLCNSCRQILEIRFRCVNKFQLMFKCNGYRFLKKKKKIFNTQIENC